MEVLVAAAVGVVVLVAAAVGVVVSSVGLW